jgi:molybdopterin converting factor small subunit
MRVVVKYLAQVKQAAGCPSEAVELNGDGSVAELMRRLAEQHGEPLRALLLGSAGMPHHALLLFVGGEQVHGDSPRELRDGDVVTVLAPMAGG